MSDDPETDPSKSLSGPPQNDPVDPKTGMPAKQPWTPGNPGSEKPIDASKE